MGGVPSVGTVHSAASERPADFPPQPLMSDKSVEGSESIHAWRNSTPFLARKDSTCSEAATMA